MKNYKLKILNFSFLVLILSGNLVADDTANTDIDTDKTNQKQIYRRTD